MGAVVAIGDAAGWRAAQRETPRRAERPVSCACAWCREPISFRAGEWQPADLSHGLCSVCRGILLESLKESEPPPKRQPLR